MKMVLLKKADLTFMLNAPKDNESCTCRQRKIMKSEESKDSRDIMRQINIFDSNSPF